MIRKYKQCDENNLILGNIYFIELYWKAANFRKINFILI